MTSLPMPPRADDHRLWLSCAAAVCLHLLVLFGVGLAPQATTPNSLEVTLAITTNPSTALTARVLAPVTQSGGGLHRDLRAQQLGSVGRLDLAGLRQADDLITRANQSSKGSAMAVTTIAPADHAINNNSQDSSFGTDDTHRVSRREYADDMPANLARDSQTRYASDDSRLTGVGLNTRASRQAAYRDTWRQHVEHAGTANFPWSVLTFGQPKSLTLQVIMRADGTVARTQVLRSSGLPMLDKAALNILHLAGPFPPFPEDLRKDTQELSFSYKWEFLPGDRATLHVGRP